MLGKSLKKRSPSMGEWLTCLINFRGLAAGGLDQRRPLIKAEFRDRGHILCRIDDERNRVRRRCVELP